MELSLFDSNYVIDVKKVLDFIVQNIVGLLYVVPIFVPNLYKLGYNSGG